MKPDFQMSLFGRVYSEHYDIPFKVRYYIRLWRLKWFLIGRPCWANNTTCKHNKRGYCALHRPDLIWFKERWGCSDYTWSLEKLLGAYHGGKQIKINATNIKDLTRTSGADKKPTRRSAKRIPFE